MRIVQFLVGGKKTLSNQTYEYGILIWTIKPCARRLFMIKRLLRIQHTYRNQVQLMMDGLHVIFKRCSVVITVLCNMV